MDCSYNAFIIIIIIIINARSSGITSGWPQVKKIHKEGQLMFMTYITLQLVTRLEFTSERTRSKIHYHCLDLGGC
jgi:hypothetical protein